MLSFKKTYLWIVVLAYLVFVTGAVYFIFFHLNENIKDKFAMLENFSISSAALIGLLTAFKGIDEYHDRWKERRREAAIKLLNGWEKSIENIIEVMLRQKIYEYDGYYPFLIPETFANKDAIAHPERPARLVSNYLNELKRTYSELSIFINDEALKKVLNECDKICKEVLGVFSAELHPEKAAILKNYRPLSEYCQMLEAKLNEAKKLLASMIDSF